MKELLKLSLSMIIIFFICIFTREIYKDYVRNNYIDLESKTFLIKNDNYKEIIRKIKEKQ